MPVDKKVVNNARKYLQKRWGLKPGKLNNVCKVFMDSLFEEIELEEDIGVDVDGVTFVEYRFKYEHPNGGRNGYRMGIYYENGGKKYWRKQGEKLEEI